MASFAEEIREAAKSLAAFNAVARGATSAATLATAGASRAGLGALGAGAVGFAAGAAVDIAAAGAKFFTPAAGAYAVTGSSQAFASAVTQSVIGAAQSNPFTGLLLAATGVGAANSTNERAGATTKSVTEDLRRIGVGVSDKQRQALFDISQEQEARVTEERARVDAIAGSAKELNDAKPAGAGAGFDAVVSAIQSLENVVKGLVGGRQ